MASSSSSLQRPSPSPSASFQQLETPLPTLSSLLSHLIASKRSLGYISLVQRATTILSIARTAIESTTVLNARTTFLRRSLASQVKILRGVQYELEKAAHSIHADLKAVIKNLDVVDQRLEDSLQNLKHTKWEDVFRSRVADTASAEMDGGHVPDERQVLHDFIDDRPVEELRSDIRVALDSVEIAKGNMDRSIQRLEEDLQAINAALSEDGDESPAVSAVQCPSLRVLLRGLEDHAKEMAQGLESLVKHFDLCVTAIKHTEGGGDAVAKNVKSGDLPEGMGAADFEAPTQPMTEAERVEMLQVLENDAAEVDDVVIELQDRHADMEAQLEQILISKQTSQALYTDMTTAVALLEKVGGRISSHVADNATYSTRWAEERAKIENGMAGMEDLHEVYDNFLTSYDRLIVEFARRRASRKQMEKMAAEAQAKLDKLHDEDAAEREAFHNDQGNWLPSDIWQGLTSQAPRFTVSGADLDQDRAAELPRETVEEALRRLKAA